MNELEILLAIKEFEISFNEYNLLFLARYDRYIALRDEDAHSIDARTYFDMLIVQLRVLLAEDCKVATKDRGVFILNNYSLINCLEISHNDADRKRLLDMKEIVLIPGGGRRDLTLGGALRLLANKDICHYQNHHLLKRGDASGGERMDLSYEQKNLIRELLLDRNNKYNIDYVVNCIRDIFKDGIELLYNEILLDSTDKMIK